MGIRIGLSLFIFTSVFLEEINETHFWLPLMKEESHVYEVIESPSNIPYFKGSPLRNLNLKAYFSII